MTRSEFLVALDQKNGAIAELSAISDPQTLETSDEQVVLLRTTRHSILNDSAVTLHDIRRSMRNFRSDWATAMTTPGFDRGFQQLVVNTFDLVNIGLGIEE